MKRTEAMRKGYLAMPSLGERGNEWSHEQGEGDSHGRDRAGRERERRGTDKGGGRGVLKEN